MTTAIEIGYYFLEHAQACYSLMETNKSIENAVYVVSQIEKKKAKLSKKVPSGELPPYEIWRVCKGKRFSKVDDIYPVLKILEDYGYVRAITTTNLHTRGRPTGDRYILNPIYFKNDIK